jgi:DNA-binding NarL/FixJ family response regulator
VTVLIVDDDRIIRALVRQVLRRIPQIAIIGEVEDGQKAVAMAQANRPDLIVMDIQMPELDGLDATAPIMAAMPKTRVIVYSANNTQGDIDRAFAMGAFAFVAKPHLLRLREAILAALP